MVLKMSRAIGFNADTMTHVPKGFYDAAVKLYKPIAMEAEGGITSTWDLNYVTLGWAEGWNAFEPGAVNNIPNVDKAKWISEGKAMHNWCDRWSGDRAIARLGGKTVNKTAELQVSFFNGLGYETWENVWGTWNGIHDRDGETIRRVATLLRYFGNRDFLTSTDWEPHTNDAMMMERGVFASAFPRGHEIVYFLVNMQPISVRGEQLRVETAHNGSIRWFDCYNGVEIEKGECPTTACRMPVWTTNSTGDFIHMDVPANGFACVVGTQNSTTLDDGIPGPSEDELRGQDPVPPPADLTSLLKTMATLTKRPLSTFSDEFHFLPQTMVDADLKTPLRPASSTTSPSETFVSGGHFHFIASGVELEGGPDSGVDVQYPWEEYPRRHHDHELQIGPMIVDTFPVTNKQYSEFLNESGYSPRDTANWLKQNFVDGLPRPGWESKPVTYVSLEDAKAYCAHYKKRLPNPMEWQYFAQGTDGRLYPWGNYDDYTKTPALSNNWTNPGPEPVGKYPAGASPFHIQDLVRSVWQYTSEFQDNHTRAVILRGGSNYGPYRGKECRWIDNDDGTPKEFGVTGPNGMPACFNRSIAGTMHEQHVNSNVRGSFDLASGRNLTHVNGGSHWYFPPAFKLNSYNKYYLMSGSYERAGTVGFRCIADAEAGPPTPPPAARRNSSATCSPHLPLCLLPLVDTYPIYPRNAVGNRPIMLSQPSAPGNRVLDWIHWSHVTSAMQQHRSTFVWAADRKKLGVQPSIWHPANSSSLVNYTTIIQYKWHGGVDADRQAEQDTAAPHTAGVATNGSVTMTIPNHEGRWQLTLFVGVLNATAKLTVSHAATGRTLTRLVDVSSQPADTAGDDNLEWNIAGARTRTLSPVPPSAPVPSSRSPLLHGPPHRAVNKKVVVVFQGSIKITWAMQSNGQEQPHSSVSWQAAVMEVPAS
jgi:iron(II)-dependent oxidoreductase